MEFNLYKFCKCLVLAICLTEMILIHVVSVRSQQAIQSSRSQSKVDKFEIFKAANDVLVLLPPGVDFNDSQAKNRSIKLSVDTLLNQKNRVETYGDLALDEQVDIEPRIGIRESRKVNLLRSLWNKPKISPLYLVNGTVCRFVNSTPICTTLTTTGIMPTGNNTASLPVFGRGGLDQLSQFSTNQQQFQTNQQQQQQFPNTNNQQQQFSNNNQQQPFPNNPQQINNQQQSRPTIG